MRRKEINNLGKELVKKLNVKPKMHHIAIFDDILFAFNTHFTGFFNFLFTAKVLIVFKGDDFGADKPFFKITVNDSCGLRCRGANRDGPGTDLFFSGGKIGL